MSPPAMRSRAVLLRRCDRPGLRCEGCGERCQTTAELAFGTPRGSGFIVLCHGCQDPIRAQHAVRARLAATHATPS